MLAIQKPPKIICQISYLWERKPWVSSDPQRCLCLPQIWNLRSRYVKDYPSNGLDQGLANSGLWTKSGVLPVSVNKVLLDYSHPCTYCLWLLSHYNVSWVVGIEISGPAKPKIFTICTLIEKKKLPILGLIRNLGPYITLFGPHDCFSQVVFSD